MGILQNSPVQELGLWQVQERSDVREKRRASDKQNAIIPLRALCEANGLEVNEEVANKILGIRYALLSDAEMRKVSSWTERGMGMPIFFPARTPEKYQPYMAFAHHLQAILQTRVSTEARPIWKEMGLYQVEDEKCAKWSARAMALNLAKDEMGQEELLDMLRWLKGCGSDENGITAGIRIMMRESCGIELPDTAQSRMPGKDSPQPLSNASTIWDTLKNEKNYSPLVMVSVLEQIIQFCQGYRKGRGKTDIVFQTAEEEQHAFLLTSECLGQKIRPLLIDTGRQQGAGDKAFTIYRLAEGMPIHTFQALLPRCKMELSPDKNRIEHMRAHTGELLKLAIPYLTERD